MGFLVGTFFGLVLRVYDFRFSLGAVRLQLIVVSSWVHMCRFGDLVILCVIWRFCVLLRCGFLFWVNVVYFGLVISGFV